MWDGRIFLCKSTVFSAIVEDYVKLYKFSRLELLPADWRNGGR
jgi:hypothetical protein